MVKRTSESVFIIPLIVIAQFACTSLWFASNAVIPDLQNEFHLTDYAIGNLTSFVQFGFIIGTLIFALLSISDRFSPSKIFFICAVAGAIANASILFTSEAWTLFLIRGLVGFFLAGIYPVGMKISADYREKGLGKVLGYLVGALVIGTALPHLLKSYTLVSWHYVIYATSFLALLGGTLIYLFVPDGPYRKQGGKLELSACFTIFREKRFRAAAFGYFGHMWELYTVWAFIPLIITQYNFIHGTNLNVGKWSFMSIAIGGLACVIGGYLAKNLGSARTAFFALLISGLCCLTSFISFQLPLIGFLFFLIIWGMSVVADSPQFSSLVAQFAPAQMRGTALTIVNSIGFAITIVSLQFMNILIPRFDVRIVFVFLAIGPLFGLISLKRTKFTE